jgi:hypothetical protein
MVWISLESRPLTAVADGAGGTVVWAERFRALMLRVGEAFAESTRGSRLIHRIEIGDGAIRPSVVSADFAFAARTAFQSAPAR